MKYLIYFLFIFFISLSFSQNMPSIKVGEDRLGITSLDIKTVVTGNVATTTYDMLFFNPSSNVLEGELAFPLGEAQRVSRLALEVNGKLREAVVVEKEQGRIAFEAVVRRGVDPVLLEKGTGNNYKARIYPIPSRGHKRVVLAYEQELIYSEGSHYFQLPLNFKNSLDVFNFEMNLVGQKIKPNVTKGNIGNFQFSSLFNSYFAKIEKKNYTPKESLTIKIPQEFDENNIIGFEDYFYLYKTLSVNKRAREKVKSITLLWDVSLSMESRDLEKESNFLDAYFSYLGNVNVELVKFSNAIKLKENFIIKDGNWDDMRAELETSIYDGGTFFSTLFTNISTNEVLLFSDGMKNLSDIIVNTNTPIFCVNSQLQANHNELNNICKSTNGEYINIKNLSSEEALNKIKYKSFKFLGFESSNKNLEIYPKFSKTVSSDFSISGKNLKINDTVILKFGYGNKVTKRDELVIKPTVTNVLVKRMWAQKKLNELQTHSDINKEDIIKHSKTYNLVSDHTSLIVLETVWDYVNYKIEPPAELKEEYYKIISRNNGKKIVSVLDDGENEEQAQALTQSNGTGNISGTVTDNSGLPLPGATIIVKGTSIGTTTDFDGKYSINASKGADIAFSYVGYVSLETTVADSNIINISMQEDSAALEEVVVIGYATSKKSSLTGAVSVIKRQEIENYSTTIGEALAGKVAGVQVASNNGSPGITSNITIRGATSLSGNNQPLYVIDGVPVDGNIDEYITPSEIESINVIKDVAGASIYGARASNGVIVINTRMGSNNGYSNYNTSSSVSNKEKIKKYKGSLKVDDNQNKEIYIKELSQTKTIEEAYKMYLTQREAYKDTPTYFIDVFDFFKEKGSKEYAIMILTNVAEIDFDNYEHLRVLAYKFEEINKYGLASFIYKRVLELRPEDSQSYRDLALSYQEIGLKKESYNLFDSIISGTIYKNKNRRVFSGIEQISRNEISKSQNNDFKTKNETSKTYDIRVVIDWNHNDTDIDLHVIDPNKEECFYSHNKTKIGGKLSQDMTQGFGPEEFTLKSAKEGEYFVKIKYFEDRYQKINTPTFMKVTMFKNYGKQNETKEIKVVRLSKRKEKMIIAKLVI